MHLFSLLLGGMALTIGTVAVSIAAVLDVRDRDRRTRHHSDAKRHAPHAGPPTAHLWQPSSVDCSRLLADDLSSESGPDIIVGPWKATPSSIDERPRKAA